MYLSICLIYSLFILRQVCCMQWGLVTFPYLINAQYVCAFSEEWRERASMRNSYGIEFLCPQSMSWNDLFLSLLAEASSTFCSGSGGRVEYSMCPSPMATTSDLNRGCPRGSLYPDPERFGMLLKQLVPDWTEFNSLLLLGRATWRRVLTFSLWQWRETALWSRKMVSVSSCSEESFSSLPPL